jgi:predicted type IV restriction endonuclease
MATIPARVAERIRSALKKYQPILAAARVRDVNESDTVVIVTDLLQEVFGYDKYAEITSEHMIRSTFCDLAIKLDGKLSLLIEVKAVGLELKDNHIKQAVDYAANQGCDWVGLTNGICWRVYKVQFTKPIAHECVVEIDLLALNPRSKDDIDVLGVIAKEGWKRAKLDEYHEHRQALSRFTLGAIVLSEPVVHFIRRELRRVVDVMVAEDDVKTVLREEVIKREVLEGEKALAAAKQVARAESKALRRSTEKGAVAATTESPPLLTVDVVAVA